jgi:hypothetical protein
MNRKHKELDSVDDLRDSITHLDQVSARISRLLTDLAAPKPTPEAEGDDSIQHPATGA